MAEEKKTTVAEETAAEKKPAAKKTAEKKKEAKKPAAEKKPAAKKAAAPKAEKAAAPKAAKAEKKPAAKAAKPAKKEAEGDKVKIVLKKSLTGCNKKQIAVAHSLGLKRRGDVTIQPDNAPTKGKIAKISFLVACDKA